MSDQSANKDNISERLTALILWADNATNVDLVKSEVVPCTRCSEWETKMDECEAKLDEWEEKVNAYDLLYNKFVYEIEKKDMALAELIDMIESYVKNCKCDCVCISSLVKAYKPKETSNER
jgi:hypothetical protein